MIEQVGVIGGGQMGSQIASLSAIGGFTTHIFDNDIENLSSKLNFAEKNLENLVSKGVYDEKHLENFRQNLHIAENIKEVSENKTFMIEAVVEKLEVKLEIFSELSELTNEKVILATNSSFISTFKSNACNSCSKFSAYEVVAVPPLTLINKIPMPPALAPKYAAKLAMPCKFCAFLASPLLTACTICF